MYGGSLKRALSEGTRRAKARESSTRVTRIKVIAQNTILQSVPMLRISLRRGMMHVNSSDGPRILTLQSLDKQVHHTALSSTYTVSSHGDRTNPEIDVRGV